MCLVLIRRMCLAAAPRGGAPRGAHREPRRGRRALRGSAHRVVVGAAGGGGESRSAPLGSLMGMPGASSSLLGALRERVVVADGAMGTMLQAADLSLDDFQGFEGCNEILNVSRPDVVRGVHDAYFRAGADAVEANTFGANWANLGEYGIVERIRELARAGATLAKEVADGWSTPDRPRWVLGSVGPGTKLP